MKNNKKGFIGMETLLYVALIFGIFMIIFAENSNVDVTPSAIHEGQKISETKIIALNDSTDLEGHGGLFYVSINEDNVYKVISEKEDGHIEIMDIPANKTRLYESDKEDPRVEQYKSYVPGAILGHIGVRSYRIYVPAGTVTRDFKVDFNK